MIFRPQGTWSRTLLFVCLLKLVCACSKDSKKIGVCLHTYLERDFPSIEMIVYPKGGSQQGDLNHKGRTLLLEGPKLEVDCKHLKEVLECFVEVLKGCQYMESFFEYRRLIESLEKTHSWLCGNITSMRERFVVILTKLECMEKVWKIQCKPPDHEIPENTWNRILRLEEDSNLCGYLVEKRKCLVESKSIRKHCGEEADQVYTNMSHVFLTSWCSSAHFVVPSHLISSFIPLFSIYLKTL